MSKRFDLLRFWKFKFSSCSAKISFCRESFASSDSISNSKCSDNSVNNTCYRSVVSCSLNIYFPVLSPRWTWLHNGMNINLFLDYTVPFQKSSCSWSTKLRRRWLHVDFDYFLMSRREFSLTSRETKSFQENKWIKLLEWKFMKFKITQNGTKTKAKTWKTLEMEQKRKQKHGKLLERKFKTINSKLSLGTFII